MLVIKNARDEKDFNTATHPFNLLQNYFLVLVESALDTHVNNSSKKKSQTGKRKREREKRGRKREKQISLLT